MSEGEHEKYIWLEVQALLALHERSLVRFGGSHGLRDRGLLESAMARPQSLMADAEEVSLPELAAAYLVGIVRNHPFVDGNKRAGLAAAGTFLDRNGKLLQSDQAELYALVVAVATGDAEESFVARWIATRLADRKP